MLSKPSVGGLLRPLAAKSLAHDLRAPRIRIGASGCLTAPGPRARSMRSQRDGTALCYAQNQRDKRLPSIRQINFELAPRHPLGGIS